MLDLLMNPWPLWPAVGAFAAGTLAIAVFGFRLAGVVDRLADRTGLGEAIAGAILLGGSTSIAGIVVTTFAAASGQASLAVSNAIGGLAAQTAFIVVADLVYRRANLEHAAASLTNIFNSLLMLALLGIVLLGATSPPVTIAQVHPATALLVLFYAFGVRLSRRVQTDPMWQPERTQETVIDEPQDDSEDGVAKLWTTFGLLALTVAASGYVVARSGLSIITATGLSATLVGAFFTSVSTSLPELVTAVAAVRARALTLAVGGIVGGNAFDVLFVALGDVAYRDGSIYAAMSNSDLFVVGWTIVLVGILAAGLVRREPRGIGFEGFAVLATYLAGIAIVGWTT